MILVEINGNNIRTYSNNGLNKKSDIASLYREIEANPNRAYYICSNNIVVNQQLAEKYINVKVFDSKEYSNIFQSIDENTLKLSPNQVLRAMGAFKKYGSDVCIVNIDQVLTIDIYRNAEYYTGSIFPSFELLFTSIQENNYPLQKFNAIDNEQIFDVPNQIAHGVINGYVGALANLLSVNKVSNDQVVIFSGNEMLNFITFYGQKRLQFELGIEFQLEDDLVFQALQQYYGLVSEM